MNTTARSLIGCLCFLVALVAVGANSAVAENLRGSADGATTAKGYTLPSQLMHVTPEQPAANMYPVAQIRWPVRSGRPAADYMRTLIKYPPQFKVGFMSNNPPLYDVVPTVKEAIKMWWYGPSAGGR